VGREQSFVAGLRDRVVKSVAHDDGGAVQENTVDGCGRDPFIDGQFVPWERGVVMRAKAGTDCLPELAGPRRRPEDQAQRRLPWFQPSWFGGPRTGAEQA